MLCVVTKCETHRESAGSIVWMITGLLHAIIAAMIPGARQDLRVKDSVVAAKSWHFLILFSTHRSAIDCNSGSGRFSVIFMGRSRGMVCANTDMRTSPWQKKMEKVFCSVGSRFTTC